MENVIKFEEFRMRESSRDHFGKRGLVVHGRLLRHKKIDRSEVKRACFTTPEGEGNQHYKTTL